MMNSSLPDTNKPAWLNDDASLEAPTTPLKATSTAAMGSSSSNYGSGNVTKTADQLRNARYLYYALKLITIGLSVLMATTAIIGVGQITGVDKTGKLFVASYMFFFSVLLFSFETMQILPQSNITEKLDYMYRRNFGFLYNCMGKSFFIIFIAFLSFGLGDPVNLSMGTGISFAAFGAGTLSLYLKYPELFD